MTNKTVLTLAIASISVAAILGSLMPSQAAQQQNSPWTSDISNLQTLLQGEINTISGNLGTLTTGLNNEAASRQAGEAALSSQINNLNNLIVNPPPKPSQVDAFLDINGIQGESTNSAHPNTIEIDSWSFGETQSGTVFGGGGGAGKVTIQDMHFVTKKIDKSSPKLFLAAATGEHIPDATLYVRKAGASFDYLKITMTDVIVSSFQTGGSGSSEIPTESVSLNFAKIKFEYKGTDTDGSPLPPISGGWDIISEKKT